MRRLPAALLLAFLSAADAFARAGGGGGYHGGHHGGGSFGGGGFHSSGGHFSSSGGGDLSGLLVWFAVRHPFIAFAWIAAIGFYLYFQSGAASLPIDLPPPGEQPRLDSELQSERRAAIENIRAADPGFDEDCFLKRAAGAFLVIQDAWSRQDMARARAFISDGVFERFSRQIAEYKERGVRNRMSGVEVREASALGYRSGRHYDAVYVAFAASAVDELVKLGSDEIVSGGPDSFTEVWTFLRRPGTKTLQGPGLMEGHCPSCGAPLPIVDSAQCETCKAWVNSGEHDWVLVSITQSGEWALPQPDRTADGWAELSASDPGLSLEALEDRAAVAFWRWLDARRRADSAPLRGVASTEFFRTLSFEASFEREAAVGAVLTVCCQKGADFDRVHVQVRWEADKYERREGAEPVFVDRDKRVHFFVFRRRAGAVSDPKKGLRAARCPSCGAPSDQADSAACAYCGRAFNDGSVAWVLDDIVPFGLWRRPGG